jgi:hypothetical protein
MFCSSTFDEDRVFTSLFGGQTSKGLYVACTVKRCSGGTLDLLRTVLHAFVDKARIAEGRMLRGTQGTIDIYHRDTQVVTLLVSVQGHSRQSVPQQLVSGVRDSLL